MQGFNVILLYDTDVKHILMCKRRKDPYQGLYNLVGGKIEPNEDGYTAAYRELFEETSVTDKDVVLTHVMDFTYHISNCYVEVYAGKLIHDVTVKGDENELFWSDLNHDFFDMEFYAGEGNIGHMMEQVKLYTKEILDNAI